MIGQKKLLATLSRYTSASLPKTMLFVGPSGCGKHLLAAEIAKQVKFELVELNESVDQDKLLGYCQRPIKTIYLINLNSATAKAQNQYLKLIEEPGEYMYFILISDNETNILPTVANRCIKYHFENYSLAELKEYKYFDNELIYKICTTPGQLRSATDRDITKLYDYCNKVVTKISLAPYANTMKLALDINYKEEYNKLDFLEFFNMMKYVAFEDYLNTGNEKSFNIYSYVAERFQQFNGNSLAKESFMLNFLAGLWEITR